MLVSVSHNSKILANTEVNHDPVNMRSLAEWYGIEYDNIVKPQSITRDKGLVRFHRDSKILMFLLLSRNSTTAGLMSLGDIKPSFS